MLAEEPAEKKPQQPAPAGLSTSSEQTEGSVTTTTAVPYPGRVPIQLSDNQNANFLWTAEREELSNASEEEGDPYRRITSSGLRRSDYLSKEETTELSVDAKNYLGDESSAIGYVFSAQDTQEVIQTDSSSWGSEEDNREGSTRPSYRNWHDGFQRIASRIAAFDKATSGSAKIDAYTELILMTEDFLLAARIFGRIIISEAHLPLHEKTVPPISVRPQSYFFFF
jgi:hypothetical protein